MSNQNRHPATSLFTQVDISAGASTESSGNPAQENNMLLRQLLAAQDRQNELMEELVTTLSAQQRQRNAELNQWKKANPQLAKSCRHAAESLSKVHIEFLNKLTEEVEDNYDVYMDGEFMLSEFVDRYGPRLAHLNGVLQVLSQLAMNPEQQPK